MKAIIALGLGGKRFVRNLSRAYLKIAMIAVVSSLIISINVAIGTSAQLDYASSVDDLPAHAILDLPLDHRDAGIKAIGEISGIRSFEYLFAPGALIDITSNSGSFSYSSINCSLLGLPENSDKIQSILGYRVGNLEPGTVAVTEELAEGMGISQGDPVVLDIRSRYTGESLGNKTLVVARILDEREGSTNDLVPAQISSFKTRGMLTNSSDLIELVSLGESSFQSLSVYLWYEDPIAYAPGNIKGAYDLENTIRNKLSFADPTVQSYIPIALDEYRAQESERRSAQTILALPIVVFSLYICVKASKYQMIRNDHRSLSLKGLSNRQFLISYTVDWAAIGLLAGAFGYILGTVTGNLLVPALAPDIDAPIDRLQIGYLPVSIILSMSLSFIVGGLEYHALFKEKSARRSLRFHVGLISISLLPCLTVLFNNFARGDDLITYFSLQLTSISLPLSIISSVLLIIGLSNILLRTDNPLVSTLSKIYRRYLKELYYAFQCRIRRVDKDQHLAIILALLVAYLLFTSVLFSSREDYAEREDLMINGSDVKITNIKIAPGIEDIEQRLRSIERIEHASIVYSSFVRIYGNMAQIHAFNITSFESTIRSDVGSSLSEIRAQRDVIITRDLSADLDLQVGDELPIRMGEGQNGKGTFKVVAVVNALPGLVTTSSGPLFQVYMAAENFNTTDLQPSLVLLKAREGASSNAVINEVRPLFEQSSYRTLEARQGSEYMVFNRVEIVYLLFMTVVGITGTSMNDIAERKQEIACFRSRGIGRGRMIAFILSETTMMSAIGVFVGLVGGLLSSMLTLTLLNGEMTGISNILQYDILLREGDLITLVAAVVFVVAATSIMVDLFLRREKFYSGNETGSD